MYMTLYGAGFAVAASAAVFCTQPRVILVNNKVRYKVKLILVFQLIYAFLNVYKIKLNLRNNVFVIYDYKSHYPSTYNVLWKKQSYVRRIYNQLNLV